MLAIAVVEADLFGTKKSLDADILPLEEASLLPYFHNSLLYVVEGETFLPLGHGLIILISMFRYIVMNVTFYYVYILISYITKIGSYCLDIFRVLFYIFKLFALLYAST